MMSGASRHRTAFEIFNYPEEQERPKPVADVRPRHIFSVREPPIAKGKLTTAERLKIMRAKNSDRLKNSDRQKLEREKALACRQVLRRRKEDPNLVFDLTREAATGNQSNTPTQPDELVSDDDEDEQDFVQLNTARTLLKGPDRATSPRHHTKPPQKHSRSGHQITELSDDENVPRSRLKKKPRHNQPPTRRQKEPSKRVSLPASSSVFAPNVRSAMRAKSQHRHRSNTLSTPRREPFKSVNRHEKCSNFSFTVSNNPRSEQPSRRYSPDKVKPRRDDSAMPTPSREFDLKITTISARAKELREVYEISDDEDFAECDVQVKKKDCTHHKASISHRGTQNASKRPRAARPEGIPTSTFYGSTGGRMHVKDGVSPLKARSPRAPSDGIASLKIEDQEKSRVDQHHEKGPERPSRKSSKRNIQYDSSDEEHDSAKDQIDPRFRPLSGPELEVVRSLTFKVPKNRIMAKIPEANIELKAGDFSCLRGSRWLNDEIINSFVALINARNKTQVVPDSKTDSSTTGPKVEEDDEITEVAVTSSKPMEVFRRPRPRIHLFNTFFFTRLSQHGYDYSGVRRWLKRAGKRVADLDLIMFPINLSNFHWVLAAIDLRGKQFVYLDSTFGKDSYGTIPLLRRWLHDEVADKDGDSVAADMQIDSWGTILNPAYLPQQRDDGSCGIFTLYMAEYLERGKKPDFTQDNIRILRQRTALFLKRGMLPDS